MSVVGVRVDVWSGCNLDVPWKFVAGGKWRLANGVWQMASVNWRLEIEGKAGGKRRRLKEAPGMANGVWKMASGKWRLEEGGWEKASGKWRLEIGGWKLGKYTKGCWK